jgi:hypothetical protein
MSQFAPLLDSLVKICVGLGEVLQSLLLLGLNHALLIAWIAWWLWGVNWNQVWPFLAKGAWAPLVLIMVVAALVWSRLAPGTCDCLGIVTIGNFWWQLGSVGLIAAVTLFCGWLQGLFHWNPPEIDLETPAPAEHHHGHQ